MNTPELVCRIFDYIDGIASIARTDRFELPPADLVPYAFDDCDWEARAGGRS